MSWRSNPRTTPADRAPTHREADHEQGLVLVDVDGVQVQQHEQGHQRRRDGERDREQTPEREADDGGETQRQRDPEVGHVGVGQLREQARHHVERPRPLARSGRELAPAAPPRSGRRLRRTDSRTARSTEVDGTSPPHCGHVTSPSGGRSRSWSGRARRGYVADCAKLSITVTILAMSVFSALNRARASSVLVAENASICNRITNPSVPNERDHHPVHRRASTVAGVETDVAEVRAARERARGVERGSGRRP